MHKIYYWIKPLIPRRLQLYLRRKIVEKQLKTYSDIWPINEAADKAPVGWARWPDNKKFALVLTHDVELQGGHDKCRMLMDMEMDAGFRSSFNFVAKRYEVSPLLREELREKGFDICLHGLYHDGKLYSSRKLFMERAVGINRYLKAWGSSGFRSPSMHHNLEWLHDLNIDFDMSTFDTDPFEPQSDAAGTIFPFYVSKTDSTDGYVELPYTLPQDFSLFVLMKEKNISIWKKKLDWIAEKGGMALLNVHPDYMNFDKRKNGREEYPSEFYQELLEYVKEKYAGQYWHVLPSEMASFVKENRAMLQRTIYNIFLVSANNTKPVYTNGKY